MSDGVVIAFLLLFGAGFLILEIFVPSHGLLGLLGLGMLGYGLYKIFVLNAMAGLLTLAVMAVLLPVGLVLAVKNWHRTPMGRVISPPNPVLTADDRLPVAEMDTFIGKRGRALTLLRPVGTCVFEGRRIECKAEYGVIPANATVEAVGRLDRTLTVRMVEDPSSEGVATS